MNPPFRFVFSLFLAPWFLPEAMAADPPKADEKEKAPVAREAGGAVRQRFVPVKRVAGEGNRGSGMKMHVGFPSPGNRAAMVHLGLDDSFPIRDERDRKLFDLHLVGGDDNHIVLEVKSKGAVQKIAVTRDEVTDVTVDGVKYELCFPTSHVNPGDKATTTSQAMVIVTQKS